MTTRKTTKTKLYTFDEMKEAVAQTIAEMSASSANDSDFDNPSLVATVEMAVGSRILNELDIKHEKGEL